MCARFLQKISASRRFVSHVAHARLSDGEQNNSKSAKIESAAILPSINMECLTNFAIHSRFARQFFLIGAWFLHLASHVLDRHISSQPETSG
jgi:hypothetical protein